MNRRAFFSPDGKKIIAGSDEHRITAIAFIVRMWDAETGKELQAFPSYAGKIISFSPDGKKVCTYMNPYKDPDNQGYIYTIRIWDWEQLTAE